MNQTKCANCGSKLENYLYADACPFCQHEQRQNTRLLVSTPNVGSRKRAAWPLRLLLRVTRFVES